MKHIYLMGVVLSLSLVACSPKTNRINEQSVIYVANQVAAWQVQAFPTMDTMRYWKSTCAVSWENAVFLTGLYEWANYTQNQDWLDWCHYIADTSHYELSSVLNIYNADNFVGGLFYSEMLDTRGDSACIQPTYRAIKYIQSNPPQGDYKMSGQPTDKDHWTWCDALYMAPATYAKIAVQMKDPLVLEMLHKEFEGTYSHLYCQEDSLFYRDARYFTQQEKNGARVFWGRGNSWIAGGLARLLNELPQTDDHYGFYVNLYQQMMKRIVDLQDPKGYWHASMLDPESYPNPEMSSTGLFAYALWWGINHGLLDESYFLEPAKKAWISMVGCVHKDGMLGYVQPVGADPQSVTADMTETYGAGAFVMTAREILIYLNNHR